MAIKSILVHIDSEENCETLLKSAFQLAEHFQARISPIVVQSVHSEISLFALAGPPEFSAAAIAESKVELEKEKEQVLRRIENKVESVFLLHDQDLFLDIVSGEVKQVLTEKSQYHDLLIISSGIDLRASSGHFSLPTSEIAVSTGCPVLVIPHNLKEDIQFNHPLIAWNATQESARAVSDAIPILSQATEVSIIDTQKKSAVGIEQSANISDLIEYLSLHRIEANHIPVDEVLQNTNNQSRKPQAGFSQASIPKIVKKKHNDLLVLGAYGHSQLRELFFNSQTRDLLKSVEVPVLLAH